MISKTGSPPDVLLALDRVADSETLMEALGHEYNAFSAPDGDELWRLCKERAPEVVLLAREFDGGQGARLCSKIKSRPSTRHIKVVMVGERHHPMEPSSGADGGADEVLVRPILPTEARVRVATACRLRRYAAAAVDGSRIDPLTSVFTRAHLLERLGHEVDRARQYGRSLALVLLDLDSFQQINRTLGATKGDQLLREVARVLTSRVRGVDLVARSGDDEFAVVLVETSLLTARPVAARVHEGIRGLAVDNEQAVRASAGISGWPHPEVDDAGDLLQLARVAMTRAREKGGDCVELY